MGSLKFLLDLNSRLPLNKNSVFTRELSLFYKCFTVPLSLIIQSKNSLLHYHKSELDVFYETIITFSFGCSGEPQKIFSVLVVNNRQGYGKANLNTRPVIPRDKVALSDWSSYSVTQS